VSIQNWQILVPDKAAANWKPQAQLGYGEDFQKSRTPAGAEGCHLWMGIK
jgi:hypothetical protein